MRRIVCWIGLIILFSSSQVMAQGSCAVDLEDEIIQLVQAQRAADRGDDLTATSILTSVQGQLDLILSACDRVQLTSKFVNSSETLAFFYPEGWTVRTLEDGIYAIVTSSAMIDLMENDIPEQVPEGEALIALLVQPLSGDTFDEAVDDLRDDIMRDVTPIGQQVETQIGGRTYLARNLAFNANVSGRLGFLDLSEAEEPALAAVIALAENNSLPVIEVYADALMNSLQYPPIDSLRTPGVSLDSISYSSDVTVVRNLDGFSSALSVLSPDGTKVVSDNPDEICIFEIQSDDITCTLKPEEFRGTVIDFQWSPDSRYVTFQEDALRRLIDADIWLYDVESASISNLTDDGPTASNLLMGEAEFETWVDATANWGPDNQIYVLRTKLLPGDEIGSATYELLRIDPVSGETSLVQDLTGQFDPFPVYYTTSMSLDGVMSVSPDATSMVISVFGRSPDDPNNGLWLIDLQGNDDIQQIARVIDFDAGYDTALLEEAGPRYIEGVAWNAEGTGLFVHAINRLSLPNSLSMVYHIDLDSGDIVPLVDLTGLAERDLIIFDPDDELPPAALIFTGVAIAPDFNGVIGIAVGSPDIFVTGIPFDGEAGEPVALLRVSDETLVGLSSSIASDGTALLMGLLLETE